MLASTSVRRLAALPVTLILAAGTVIAAPHTADASAASKSTRTPSKIKKAAKVAKRQLGDPYGYGSSGPGSFDCSGLTSYAFGKAGIGLPRTSDAQASKARNISRKKMRRGDLVFFHSGGNVYHVGIYWGRNNGHRLILHSPRPGQKVSFSRMWTNAWFPGRVGPKRKAAPKIKSFSKKTGPKTSGSKIGAMG